LLVSASHPALEGHVEVSEAERLRREIRGLEHELSEARGEAQKARQAASDAIQAVKALRKHLQPLYTAMRMIFGEIERVELPEDGQEPAQSASVWQERINKATPAEGRILQVLLDGGGEMSLTQIRQAAKTYNNTSTYLNRLKAKNWIQQTGRGTYSLKGGS
jgi:hypothetical protein